MATKIDHKTKKPIIYFLKAVLFFFISVLSILFNCGILIIPLLCIVFLFVYLYKGFAILPRKKVTNTIRCPNCNYTGPGKKIIKGSIAAEILLWVMFLLPGLIYSIWRITSKYYGCPKCQYPHVIKQ